MVHEFHSHGNKVEHNRGQSAFKLPSQEMISKIISPVVSLEIVIIGV